MLEIAPGWLYTQTVTLLFAIVISVPNIFNMNVLSGRWAEIYILLSSLTFLIVDANDGSIYDSAAHEAEGREI